MFVYNGEELGLPNVDLPDEVLQDPVWERSSHAERGRDGCRVPMPWEGSAPPFGFSTDADTWLPMPAEWASLTVEAQKDDADRPGDVRKAIELRHGRAAFDGRIEWLDVPAGALSFRGADDSVCVLNTGSDGDRAARRRRVGLERCAVRRQAATNTAAWLA